jgi:hypothetical protein
MNHHPPRILPLLALLALSLLPASAAPRLACKQPTFDFGTRDTSEVVDHTFVLENSGTSDLVITAIRPACGCTAANLTRQTVPPGESAELTTRLTLAGRPGDLHKTILVESNDPVNPALQLALAGKAAVEFEVLPPVLTLRQSAANQPPAGAVRINSPEKPFRITKVIASDPAINVRADPMPDGNSYQLSAAFKKSPPENPQPSQITVETDNPRTPTLSIPTTTILFKKILVAPERIILEPGKENSKKQIILKSADGTPLEIVEILKPNPIIKVDYTNYKGIILLSVRALNACANLDGQEILINFASGESAKIPLILPNK